MSPAAYRHHRLVNPAGEQGCTPQQPGRRRVGSWRLETFSQAREGSALVEEEGLGSRGQASFTGE